MREVSVDFVRRFLDYNPETGIFSWRNRAAHRNQFGDVAGCRSNVHQYIVIGLGGRLYQAHRLAWLYVHGVWPEGEIDHINGDRSDNRLSNLRDVSRCENSRNLRKPRHNKSGVVGVSWDGRKGKWFASIQFEGKTRYLGRYTNKHDAIEARRKAEQELGFHKNHGSQANAG